MFKIIALFTVAIVVAFTIPGCRGTKGKSTNTENKEKKTKRVEENIKVRSRSKAEVRINTEAGTELTVSGDADIDLNSDNADTLDLFITRVEEVDFYEPKNAALLWLAGLCIIAGIVVAVWLKQFLLGAAVSVGGTSLFALLYYPYIGAIVLAAVGLGGAVWFVYNEKYKIGKREKERNLSSALGTVVKAVESAGATAQGEVKEAVSKVAGKADSYRQVKETIYDTKKNLGL